MRWSRRRGNGRGVDRHGWLEHLCFEREAVTRTADCSIRLCRPSGSGSLDWLGTKSNGRLKSIGSSGACSGRDERSMSMDRGRSPDTTRRLLFFFVCWEEEKDGGDRQCIIHASIHHANRCPLQFVHLLDHSGELLQGSAEECHHAYSSVSIR